MVEGFFLAVGAIAGGKGLGSGDGEVVLAE